MYTVCIQRDFELLKRLSNLWSGRPGSAMGLRCTKEILSNKDGKMLSFLIKIILKLMNTMQDLALHGRTIILSIHRYFLENDRLSCVYTYSCFPTI